ncbi:hypothetical protein ACM46_15415 [Chryseobacterium angstadtii]|uniref:Sporadically distributed protein, TIGR04141 family n=1 Tax=Chryseobacterium angstadtii TaxID=558151 RepID=A0A0J7I6H7_9FLAO|nr:DUF6119 family protein [Chryseobacterium angstadtii]KMQ61411.1 hypothetical protein ACM46_15415 [Chryseobacterium angstadtii]
MSEKIQNNIYLLRDKIMVHTKTGGAQIKLIDFRYLKLFLKNKGYDEQKIKQNLDKTYEVKLFYKRAENKIKWKDFIRSISLEEEKILELEKSVSESYILFLKNNKTGKIYSSTGGYAHLTVQEIATTDFGIQILSRIIKLDDKALRATKERNLTGGVQGEVKIFRKDYNLYENEDYSKIYNELDALIDKKTLVEKFGFKHTDVKTNSICVVKNSFLLKKSISFKELLNIIEKCEKLFEDESNTIEINSIEKITRTDKVLLDTLFDEILRNVYSNYLNRNNFFSVEISNKEFERYFYASYSLLYFKLGKVSIEKETDGIIREIQSVFEILDEKLEEPLEYNEFKKVMLSSYIETFDENGNTLTLDKLIDHFCTEITYEGSSYFFIEKDWYIVKKSFVENVNNQVKIFLSENKYQSLQLNKWSSGNENDFNASHLGYKNTYVFDKITPLNIEACDLMKIDEINNVVYFYHVKKGFDNSMRDLCNQVLISAKKIEEDSRLGYAYLRKLYKKSSNYKGKDDYYQKVKKQFSTTNEEQFINLFKNKKIVFVLSVLDTAKKKRSLYSNIEKFDSNIAKFTLIDLSRQMRAIGVDFQVLQLER